MSAHFPVSALLLLHYNAAVGHLLRVRGVREGSPRGRRGGEGPDCLCPMSPLSLPSCTWYRGGERQHEAPHSFRLLHETPRPDTHFTFSGLRCQLQLFASRTSVNRCITDGNGAALQLATINVSTWINLPSGIKSCLPFMRIYCKVFVRLPFFVQLLCYKTHSH